MSLETPVQTESADPDSEEALKARFSDEHIGQLAQEFLKSGTPFDLKEMAGDRQFIVAYIPANSPYADIPRSVEARVFAETFHQPLAEVVKDYGKYDAVSTFATVIDISTPLPKAAGVLRISEYSPDVGFKDVNDLLTDSPDNPWMEEIKQNYFGQNEPYSASTAWTRLGEKACGSELKLEESLDIATHASAENYRGVHGSLSGVSMLFYHACLRYALATGKKNLLAIFDLPPLQNLQQFGGPFDVYDGLRPHPYGGPYDTLPAFCRIEEGVQRIRNFDHQVGGVFIDGKGLKDIALLPNEYEPDKYSDQAVGL